MALHTDIPTRAQIDRLLASRSPSSVSVYLETDPASAGTAERIELKNLAAEAARQLSDLGAGHDVAEIGAAFADLADDEAPMTNSGNPEATPDADLVFSARSVLDQLHASQLQALQELYQRRWSEGRAAHDVADVARAATRGAVEVVFVDIDEVIPGSIDEATGALTLSATDDAASYGVIDEIARRVWLSGGRVLAVRRDDVPGKDSVAAILRYPL